MEDILSKIVAISVGLLVAAVLLPVALVELGEATIPEDMETVGTVLTVLLPVLAVIAIALYFVPRMGAGRM